MSVYRIVITGGRHPGVQKAGTNDGMAWRLFTNMVAKYQCDHIVERRAERTYEAIGCGEKVILQLIQIEGKDHE